MTKWELQVQELGTDSCLSCLVNRVNGVGKSSVDTKEHKPAGWDCVRAPVPHLVHLLILCPLQKGWYLKRALCVIRIGTHIRVSERKA